MEEGEGNAIIDLSKQGLKQLQRTWNEADNIESLILNENSLCSLENVGELHSLQMLSAAKNRIRRMSSVPNLSNLCSLDLSNNTIVCIEGLKSLTSLKHLNLSGNYIKIIDHLNNNLLLEYLDLSDNAIGHINDVSHLTNLKELYLNKNHISHLRHCDKYLPDSLELLTLNDNSVADLAEVSNLEKLPSLKHLTLKNNPCLDTGSGKPGFNYRPYIKMWCLNISIVDGAPLDPIESLKAEWLYSQGRGRRFRPGEQEALVSFLAGACPLAAKSVTAEEDRKLLLILSKAEQYKQQLRDHPPELNRQESPSRMASSYHDVVTKHSARASPEIMSRSLDCSVLRNSPPPTHRGTPNSSVRSNTPLQAASTLVPVPESLISPDVCRPLHPLLQQSNGRNCRSPLATPSIKSSISPQSTPGSRRRLPNSTSANSSLQSTPTKIGVRKPKTNENMTPENEMSARKLQSIQLRASQKRQVRGQPSDPPVLHNSEKKAKVSCKPEVKNIASSHHVTKDAMGSDVWRAALCIQRRWRGFRARNKDPVVKEALQAIQASRMQDYIMKVAEDMEATKTALEGNRKLQVLQMKAIDAVWRKLDGSDLDGLVSSCLNLTKQVEELRGLVASLQANGLPLTSSPIATQTDIIAVRTPQGDAVFPIPSRPSRLNLDDSGVSAENITIRKDCEDTSICWTPACQEGKDLQAVLSPTPSLD